MNDHAKGLFALLTGSGLTLHELLTNGSLFLTVCGGVLALGGGWWTYRTARLNHRKAQLDLDRAELELARELDRQQTRPPFSD